MISKSSMALILIFFKFTINKMIPSICFDFIVVNNSTSPIGYFVSISAIVVFNISCNENAT